MAIVLNDITSGYNLAKINANFQNIEDYINDNLLARADTGVAGEAMMERALDMNGNKILNIFVDVNDANSLLTVGVADSRYYNVSGDTLTGPMNANSQIISNLPSPVQPSQPATKEYVDSLASVEDLNNKKSLRFPEVVPQMFPVAGRASSLQGYDNLGNPVPIFSMTDTADLAIKLASHSTSLGGALVGMPEGGTVLNAVSWVTPEMYGATGDGVADDTTAVQAALSSGKTVVFYKQYKVTARLNLTTNNQKLIGMNGARIIQTTAATTLLYGTGVSYVTIEGLILKSSNAATNTYNGACIWAELSTGWEISNNVFENYMASAVFLNKSTDITVANNIFMGAPGAAGDVTMWRSSVGHKIINNTMKSGSDTAIVLQTIDDGDASSNNIIEGNEIANCTRYGIVVYNSLETKTGTQYRTRIVNNIIYNIIGSVTNPSAGGAKTYGAGIYVLSSEGTLVSGNYIALTNQETNSTTLSPGCIGINATSSATVTNNQILAGYYYGIIISDALQQGEGTGNGTSSYIPNGFTLVSDNSVSSCLRDGIYIVNKHNVKISDNISRGNSRNGILTETTNATLYPTLNGISITNTQSSRNTFSGLSLNGCYKASVSGGNFSSNTADGVVCASQRTSISDIYASSNVRGVVITAAECHLKGSTLDSNTTGVTTTVNFKNTSNKFIDNTTDYNSSFGPILTTSSNATPDVKYHDTIILSDATTITDFLNGEVGQVIRIRASSAATTITHDTNKIRLNGSVNFVMGAGDTLTLCKFFPAQWDEVGRMKRI